MLRRRGKVVYLYKRVPKRYETVEARRHICLSLRTDSMSEVESKADAGWQQLVAGWEAKLSGDTSDAEKRFESAREFVAMRGFRYQPVNIVAKMKISELLDRVEAVPVRTDIIQVAALLGGVEKPKITVSRALDLYWEPAREKAFGKSAGQLWKWKNPGIKAVWAWWLDRIKNGGLKPSSANKDLIHLGNVLKAVNKMKRLNLALFSVKFDFFFYPSKNRRVGWIFPA